MAEQQQQERWCVVTGGRGFAARHLVEMLIRFDMYSVRIVDLGPSINLDPSEQNGPLGQALQSARASYLSADLRDKSQVYKGCPIIIILSFSYLISLPIFICFVCVCVELRS